MKSPLSIGRDAVLVMVLFFAVILPAQAKTEFRLATFSADVTPPLGHPLMAGGIKPAAKISDPLFARGWVLLGGDKPVVFVAVDWCEIRNEAYDRWRDALAQAAETDATRVIVTAVHVHDAPVADLEAQRILDAHACVGKICDIQFHEQAVQRVAAALRESLPKAQRVTQFGVGRAKVEKVASNRRYFLPDGTVTFARSVRPRMSRRRQPQRERLIRCSRRSVFGTARKLSPWCIPTPSIR